MKADYNHAPIPIDRLSMRSCCLQSSSTQSMQVDVWCPHGQPGAVGRASPNIADGCLARRLDTTVESNACSGYRGDKIAIGPAASNAGRLTKRYGKHVFRTAEGKVPASTFYPLPSPANIPPRLDFLAGPYQLGQPQKGVIC